MNIGLWDALPNVAGAIELASGSASGSAGSWVDVFWSQASVITGNTYYLVFSGTASAGLAGDVSAAYADGTLYADPDFSDFGGAYDYAFRTYTNVADQTNPARAVPEMASWALMLAGFGMVGGALRTQQRTAVRFG